MIMKKYILLLIVLLINSVVYAQKYKYRDYNYEWEEKEPKQIAVITQFGNKDAVILSNEITLRIEGQGQVDTKPFHLSTQYFITKKTRVKIITEKGKQEFRNIKLPESLDHEYDYSDLAWDKKKEIKRPKFYDYEIIYFAARIIKANGETSSIIASDKASYETIDILSGTETRTAYFYNFSLPELKVGDEIEYTYKIYYPPYKYNSSYRFYEQDKYLEYRCISNRFYFQDKYPEQSCAFHLICNKELYLIFRNNKTEGLSFDSTMVTNNDKQYIKRSWTITNLDGYGSIEGERAYIDQPYISFYQHRKEFSVEKIIRNPEYSNVRPYTWGNQYRYIADFRNPYRLQRKDKNSLEFNHLFERITNDIKDTTGLLQFIGFNDTLSSYKFFPETNYGFYSVSKSPEDYINSRSIREKDVVKFYFEMLNRLNKPYYLD